MPAVLITSSTLTCSHAATVSVEGAELLRVEGAKVLTKETVEDGSIDGCPNESSNTTKCSEVVKATDGIATRLKVGGQFVALSSLAATTDGVPAGSVVVSDAANDLLKAE
jgi:hypothetical protein